MTDFELIWRCFRESLQIKNFLQKSGSVNFLPLSSPNFNQKTLEKSIEPFLRKLRYQPTNEPIITNNTDFTEPDWRRPNNQNLGNTEMILFTFETLIDTNEM